MPGCIDQWGGGRGMKATTLWEPFATLVAHGHKKVETRDYPPLRGVIGQRIAIHAAKRRPRAEELEAVKACLQYGYPMVAASGLDLHLGKVLATAVLTGAERVTATARRNLLTDPHRGVEFAICRLDDDTRWEVPVCACGNYAVGRWLWFLEDIQLLDPPVPARGYQGWWEWTP